VDEDGLAAGAPSAFDVTPAVADHDTRLQRDVPVAGGIYQQAGSGLAASAAVSIVVRTDAHVVELQPALNETVHLVHGLAAAGAAADVGLVGDHKELETRAFELRARLGHIGQDLELVERIGRIGLPLADERAVEHAIPVEKDSPRPARHQRTDSHFVDCVFSAGWLTSRCQRTAQSPSVWGVTRSALSGGMITHASADW